MNGGGADGDGAPESEGEDDLDGLVDTEKRVCEAMLTTQAQFDIPLETLPSDIHNEKAVSDFMPYQTLCHIRLYAVSDFMLAGCGCKKGGGGKQCCIEFSQEYVLSVKLSCTKLRGVSWIW